MEMPDGLGDAMQAGEASCVRLPDGSIVIGWMWMANIGGCLWNATERCGKYPRNHRSIILSNSERWTQLSKSATFARLCIFCLGRRKRVRGPQDTKASYYTVANIDGLLSEHRLN